MSKRNDNAMKALGKAQELVDASDDNQVLVLIRHADGSLQYTTNLACAHAAIEMAEEAVRRLDKPHTAYHEPADGSLQYTANLACAHAAIEMAIQ